MEWITFLFSWFHQFPPEPLWLIQVFLYFFIILFLLRFLGYQGLFLYIIIAICAANLQSLKIVHFSFMKYPVAMGTELFATLYLATDILVEYYHPKLAQRAIILGILGYFFLTLFMMFALAYAPVKEGQEGHESLKWALENHNLMSRFFLPIPGLFLAGIIAYFISQLQEIYLFSWLSKKTHKRFLWLRNIVAGGLAALLDIIVFSFLAWRVFTPYPVDEEILWSSYILGSFLLRITVSVLNTPFLYWARSFLPPQHPLKRLHHVSLPKI